MTRLTPLRMLLLGSLMSIAVLIGCKTDQQKALDQAQSQAATTKSPQQVQYIDKDGNTVTTIVQPPNSGQPQIVTTTTPPAPGTHPAATAPVIIPANESVLSAQQAAQNPAPTTQDLSASTQATGVAPMNNGAPPPPLQLTVPAGTEIAMRINQNISVKHTVAGDHFSGEIVEPVSRNGVVVIPRGTPVSGRVDAAHRRGHFKGRSVLELRLTSMTLNGNQYALDTHDNVRTKKGKGKRTAGFIGGLTGAGMLIGGIASGGVGLAIGAASGAGAGTLIAGTTGNRDIDIPAESIVHFRLADNLVVQNP
jgi:hypothetical protein